ncbi:MAG: universal stress protein [Burkholderiales bacterium]|nr:universal stress protein [Burkholderiales bacterium]
MFRRILVPTDGSPAAGHAVSAAARLARLADAQVIALHVVGPVVPAASWTGLGVIGAPVPLDVAADPVPPERDRALADARRIAREAGVAIDSRQIRAPQAAAAILNLAEAEGCDLIVMASNGYGDLLSIITGSITARVVSGSDLPVLVVH